MGKKRWTAGVKVSGEKGAGAPFKWQCLLELAAEQLGVRDRKEGGKGRIPMGIKKGKKKKMSSFTNPSKIFKEIKREVRFRLVGTPKKQKRRWGGKGKNAQINKPSKIGEKIDK